ncbi:hypothetical protein PG985_000260 [Apiospora marii]|uniref:uncharacterized protein n=1 Tax=Apiospora marii TaxID=335849 RepID=UPI0031318B05
MNGHSGNHTGRGKGRGTGIPHSAFSYTSNLLKHPIPLRPRQVDLPLDVEHAHLPLKPFDPNHHEKHFGSSGSPSADPPAGHDESYLAPYLTPNESSRLAAYWYHTRLIEQDEQLLAKIDTLVNGLQKAIGWGYAIAGLLSESTFTRVAAANLPLASLPGERAPAPIPSTRPSAVFSR